MSVCLESSSVLASPSQVGASSDGQQQHHEDTANAQGEAKSVAKLVPSAPPAVPPVLQKVGNPPLITVLNSSGPITVVKTLCVTSAVTSAPQFTLVSSAPTTVGKPTITLLNAPVTVVKAISQPEKAPVQQESLASPIPAPSAAPVVENRGHNVFVKNTACTEVLAGQDVPQSHKILTANNFPPTNILGPQQKTANGQRNKLKIYSNVIVPGPSQGGNFVLNKVNQGAVNRCVPKKVVGANGAKYGGKCAGNNVVKGVGAAVKQPQQQQQDKGTPRVVYPTHKGQFKVGNNYVQKGIKTLSPQKGAQVQKSNPGLRTIPARVGQKLPNKTNYIGKHAVQAQKLKGKVKGKQFGECSFGYGGFEESGEAVTFTQALTAEIIETLGKKSAPPGGNFSKHFEIVPNRYENAYKYPEHKVEMKQGEEKTKSGLDALSLICQAVLLDHNYNATLPPDSPTRISPPQANQIQVNGVSNASMYSPPINVKRRVMPQTNLLSATSSLSSISVTQSLSNNSAQDDDNASDVSDISDRKHDTEGEETDTAPEAEAVNNEEQMEHYGDYITRCICGFVHDDGYMVECDRCKVWQHVQCVVKNKQIPKEFLCELCDQSKPVDRQKARMVQQQWLRERNILSETKIKKKKVKEVKRDLTDSDSSDGEVGNNNNIKGRGLAARRKSEGKQRQRRDSGKEKRVKRKERRMVKKRVKRQSEDEGDGGGGLPQLRQWIEKYEEAVTNHYSPELRARISSIRVNGVHSDLSMQFDSSVCKCRVHTQPLTEIKYLVSTCSLPPNTPVVELRGKYMLSTQHRNSGGALSTRQHSQRPGPFLFFYRLHKDNTEVCVDTRTYGNSARFIRRSCKPNAELRHCIEKGVLHLYIVSITSVEKNCELTIKHESHDLAAIGTTQIACACGNPEECTLNKTSIKKNGETAEVRKRRGRRTISVEVKEEKVEVKEEPVEVKEEKVEVKEEIKGEVKEEIKEEEEEVVSPIVTRRSSHYKSDKEDSRDGSGVSLDVSKEDKAAAAASAAEKKKLSREERKLEAILRAIAQMEKADQRKQEHKEKVQRRESEPGLNKDEDKVEAKVKRKRRKGRARTTSTNNQTSRRSRLNSTDSYLTSGDETMLSPNEGSKVQSDKDVGLLLALSNGDNVKDKSPVREDYNSNSAQSSPETQLSSACLLVQAAVEPLESGFKLPKTKKDLMNEWLNKVPVNSTQSGEFEQGGGGFSPAKSIAALVQAANYCGDAGHPRGSAKKRWLRQAISEDHSGDSQQGESPPVSEMVAPPKKRRLPRESLSNEASPPTTPTNISAPVPKLEEDKGLEGCVEIVSSRGDGDSPSQVLESESVLKERAAKMKQEFAMMEVPAATGAATVTREGPVGFPLDPRLRESNMFAHGEHLVGTVEKTLSILGFENQKAEAVTPAKRKLSITEYRQRKKLNNNDKCDENEAAEVEISTEENTSESFKGASRQRSDSTSSSTSLSSSDDEAPVVPEVVPKALSAFNSEPTELERQREISSLRLKKAFGLPVDEERKPSLNVEAILNCELPPIVKPPQIPQSSNVPIPGSCEPAREASVPVQESPKPTPPPSPTPVELQEEGCGETETEAEVQPNLFYIPDEEDEPVEDEVVEETESVSYVPPFNNPVYPNSSFTAFASSSDDDGRYEGRNPSPPPNMEPEGFPNLP